MADEEDELIQRTCGTLQRYYESLNQEYEEGYFVEWCEEFGVDEDLLKEEAKQEAKDSLLAEFDQDTPFPLDTDDLDEEERKVQILEIILKCMWRPNIIWPGEVSLPPFNARLFVMEESDMNRTKETYCAQCPVLWNAGIYSDLSFLQILAVGLKEKFAYLLHLVDDYNKQRIEKLLKSPTEEDWPEASWSSPHNHRHFKKLHNIKVNILRQPTKEDPDQNKYLTMDYKECAKMAVVSFSKRCCGKMLFNTMMQIDDSIQKFFEYLALTLDFITNLIEDCKKTQKVLCPFMMDVLLAVGAPKFIDQDQTITKSEEVIKDTENKPGVDGSSSESSDDDDECDKYIDNLEDGLDIAKEWVDCIGSVKARLEAQKLSYIKSSIDDSFTFRSLGELFKQFINDNKLKGGKGFPYPYSRRFMILIDRRRPSDKNEEALKEENPDNKYPNSSKKRPEEDGIYIYEPPPGPITRDMPADVVPEWGISASRTCWLPHKDYDEKTAIAPTDWQKKLQEIEKNHKLNPEEEKKGIDIGIGQNGNVDPENANINSAFHAKGGLITLSFHVDQADVIKCYLYWNASLLRLFPEYMHEIIPRLYAKTDENVSFMNSEHGKELLERIKEKLIDRPFKGFLDSYCTGTVNS